MDHPGHPSHVGLRIVDFFEVGRRHVDHWLRRLCNVRRSEPSRCRWRHCRWHRRPVAVRSRSSTSRLVARRQWDQTPQVKPLSQWSQ